MNWFATYLTFFTFGGLALPPSHPPPHDPPYPAHWWNPVPREGAPDWEVLPQDAEFGEVILSKRNELGWLSNFAPTPFSLDGHRYASMEGFWQSLKYPEDPQDPRSLFPGLHWVHSRAQVERLSGFEAKKAGDLASENMRQMKINWVTYRGQKLDYRVPGETEFYRLIARAMKQKWTESPIVQQILCQTGELKLRPDHLAGPTELRAWQYHQIWMEIRNQTCIQK